AVACLLALSLSAQDKKEKPWTEWSKKDAEKILNDSPWGQTQTATDTSEMFYSPTGTPTVRPGPTAGQRSVDGATNQAGGVKYHIRFFSARPVRQALVRSMMLNMKTQPDAATMERLKNFAELQSNESIILAVTFESTDQRYGNEVMQSFNSAVTSTLKNTTYLERSDGKRVFLSEYVVPGKDGFGARFIFPRNLDGKPFITADASEVRFASDVASGLNMRFKIAKMSYNGELEY
ncbi:MAG: hypothetical protein QOF61_2971, partial [Acidobacteriota bacterium]|nr:hypothetical protein [Acidobacteriota bacterium]